MLIPHIKTDMRERPLLKHRRGRFYHMSTTIVLSVDTIVVLLSVPKVPYHCPPLPPNCHTASLPSLYPPLHFLYSATTAFTIHHVNSNSTTLSWQTSSQYSPCQCCHISTTPQVTYQQNNPTTITLSIASVKVRSPVYHCHLSTVTFPKIVILQVDLSAWGHVVCPPHVIILSPTTNVFWIRHRWNPVTWHHPNHISCKRIKKPSCLPTTVHVNILGTLQSLSKKLKNWV